MSQPPLGDPADWPQTNARIAELTETIRRARTILCDSRLADYRARHAAIDVLVIR